MASLYALKPAFINILRPIAHFLVQRGVTANQVTLAAAAISLLLGAWLCLKGPTQPLWFLALPLWMFVRMAFNAIDGILARDYQQKSPLGAFLNELTDVVSDAALYLPFAWVAPWSWPAIALVIWLSTVSEMTGALGPMVGAPRQYQGPMGKSDRALVFGALGLWVGLGWPLPDLLALLPWLLAALISYNIVRRIQGALAHLQNSAAQAATSQKAQP